MRFMMFMVLSNVDTYYKLESEKCERVAFGVK